MYVMAVIPCNSRRRHDKAFFLGRIEILVAKLGIRFMRRIGQEGAVIFCYNAVRPLGEDFEESVGQNYVETMGI